MNQEGRAGRGSGRPPVPGTTIPADAPRSDAGRGPLRLLLLEDDPGDAHLVQTMVRDAGVDAEWSWAGKLADVDFDAASDWADCALIDLGLPDSQGLEAVRKVLGRAPRLPVVVISDNAERDLALAAVREGAQDYLIKGKANADVLAKTVCHAIERKRIEHELRQAQHLARLVGGVAHHFNNVLGVILACADFVAEALSRVPEGEAAQWRQACADVEQIRQSAERAADLTRQLTIFTKQDLASVQIIQLNDVIEAGQDLLVRKAGNGITLKLALAPGLTPVLADRGHIEHILAILADNARDAMSGCGQMTISTASVENGQASDGLPAGRFARLQVHDTGAGISGKILDRVFDPFFTTKPPCQGVGLGLAVVHAIMVRWGGRVDVQSEPGRGTTFTMLFPAAPRSG